MRPACRLPNGKEAMPSLCLPEETALKLVVAPEREPLYAAIDARFDLMLAHGAIDEVRNLLDLDLDPGLPAMRAHGVRELAAYLQGRTNLEEAVAKAKTEVAPLRQAADDLDKTLHGRLGMGARCRRCHRRGDHRDARYTVTWVPISTTRSVGSWK